MRKKILYKNELDQQRKPDENNPLKRVDLEYKTPEKPYNNQGENF